MKASHYPAILTYKRVQGADVLHLDKSPILVGREPSCDLVLSPREISRVHCAVEIQKDGWYVTDKNSVNGTFVNGRRVDRQRLESGDVISFDSRHRHPIIFEYEGDSKRSLLFEDHEADVQSSMIDCAISLSDLEKSSSFWGGTTPIPKKTVDSTLAGRQTAAGEKATTSLVGLFSQVGETLLSSQDLDSMLQGVLDLVFENVPVERGCIYLLDESQDSLRRIAARQTTGGAEMRISRTIVGEVIKAKKSLLVSNALNDTRFAKRDSIISHGIRSAMCVPMCHRDEVLGFVYVDVQTSSATLTEQNLELLTALSVFAAAGVEQWKLRADMDREKSIRAELARYSAPAVVDKIVALGLRGGGQMIAEERDVSVLFADLQAFTEMSEDRSPAEVARVLNRVFEKLVAIVFRFKGTLDKFMGDGLMCVFGAPLALPDHAVRAIEAAMVMRDALAELNRDEFRDAPLRMRMGINSGLVIAGDLGAPERKDYTVLGDTVNVASRLESSVAQADQIVTGPRTYELAREHFAFEPLAEVRLRGRYEKLVPYLVKDRIAT